MAVRGASPFYPPSPLPDLPTNVGSSMAVDYCPSHIVHTLGRDIDPFRSLVEREKERTFTMLRSSQLVSLHTPEAP